MLKYGRYDKNEVLLFYWSRRTYALLGLLYFHYWSPSINCCCCCEFLINVFRIGLFLTSMTPTLPILMAKIAVLLVLDIRLPASSRIAMRTRFVYVGWIRI